MESPVTILAVRPYYVLDHFTIYLLASRLPKQGHRHQ